MKFERNTALAVISAGGILAFTILWLLGSDFTQTLLKICLVVTAPPLVFELLKKLVAGQFGSDLLAGISIITGVLLGEYLAALLVVLMLSGGEALEQYAAARARSALAALARRMPTIAHKKVDEKFVDISVSDIEPGDLICVFPHELCPVDGEVAEGYGAMDEAYLTGEPFKISKAPGADVISGAVNGESPLVIRALKKAHESRYARIMAVMQRVEENRPKLRRLGDALGAFYTPLALAIAGIAWFVSEDPGRFLSVLVVATPCPLLIAIPVAIIGAVSLGATRGIIMKNPAALEEIGKCKTIIFDKTGTLTHGTPTLVSIEAHGIGEDEVLRLIASLERYSKHPLAEAVLRAASEKKIVLSSPTEIHERPGEGLVGIVDQRRILVTNRRKLFNRGINLDQFKTSLGLECIIVIDDVPVARITFRDVPRAESEAFVSHLMPNHGFKRVILLSGDRKEEVEYLAKELGIEEVYAEKSPEDKLEIVNKEVLLGKTIYVGDGINDAPSLAAATVGIALGKSSDVTSEASDAVVLDSSLMKVDELFHISARMMRIAKESAIGGMALSILGMIAAAFGFLPPVAGALVQEGIDLLAVFNSLRVPVKGGKPLYDVKI